MKKPRVVIVHDWLYGGGAEKVVLELHRLYPEAPIYTSYCTKEWRTKLDNQVITGYLQHWPFAALRRFLPLLRQWWFRSLDLDEFDIIISSSGNGEAKFVRTTRPEQLHICYCHTPTHFYWRHYNTYLAQPSFRPRWLARLGLKLLVKPLRRRDYQAAQHVDYFIANSTTIQSDIDTFYDRDSTVIFPPVEIAKYALQAQRKPQESQIPAVPRCISWGRVVPMKRLDIAMEACQQLGWPLDIIGNGPELETVKRSAGPTTTIHGFVDDEKLEQLIAEADVFLFCAYEDFGIAPVEALSAGLPLVAYKNGGALDYVSEQKNGWFFDEQTNTSLIDTLSALPGQSISPRAISASADTYSSEKFRRSIKHYITNTWKEHTDAHRH